MQLQPFFPIFLFVLFGIGLGFLIFSLISTSSQVPKIQQCSPVTYDLSRFSEEFSNDPSLTEEEAVIRRFSSNSCTPLQAYEKYYSYGTGEGFTTEELQNIRQNYYIELLVTYQNSSRTVYIPFVFYQQYNSSNSIDNQGFSNPPPYTLSSEIIIFTGDLSTGSIKKFQLSVKEGDDVGNPPPPLQESPT
jgi:hypothetical protein